MRTDMHTSTDGAPQRHALKNQNQAVKSPSCRLSGSFKQAPSVPLGHLPQHFPGPPQGHKPPRLQTPAAQLPAEITNRTSWHS